MAHHKVASYKSWLEPHSFSLVDPGGQLLVYAPPPPMGSNSFVFAYVFTKKCPHQRSVPPTMARHPPPQREILDPPLVLNFSSLARRFINATTSNEHRGAIIMIMCHIYSNWVTRYHGKL